MRAKEVERRIEVGIPSDSIWLLSATRETNLSRIAEKTAV